MVYEKVFKEPKKYESYKDLIEDNINILFHEIINEYYTSFYQKIYNPTDSSMSLLTAQNHYDKVNNWKNRLDDKLKVLDVIFDTGSSNFWITSSLCKTSSCKLHKAYSHNQSSTSKLINDSRCEVEFGSGTIIGSFTEDTVRINNDIEIK